MKKIGILALQGDTNHHLEKMKRIGEEGVLIQTVNDFEGIEGMILPSVEPTVLQAFFAQNELLFAFSELLQKKIPLFCTGASFGILAREGGCENSFQVLNVAIDRKKEVKHQVSNCSVTGLDTKLFPAIFLRPYQITAIGKKIQILATLPENEMEIIAFRQENIVVTTFHPEFSKDARMHEYFLTMM